MYEYRFIGSDLAPNVQDIIQDVILRGNWVKGIRDFTAIFLTTICESTIISKLKDELEKKAVTAKRQNIYKGQLARQGSSLLNNMKKEMSRWSR